MNRRAFLGAAAATISAASLPWAATGAEIRDDIEIVRRSLALHPGLLRYNTATQIEERLAALQAKFLEGPDLTARYLALQRFLATVRCGHTQCNFYNQSDAVVADVIDRPTRVPFSFAWMGGRMIVLGDHTGVGALPRGTEILKLNGEKPADLLRRLLPYARADGGNDGKRVAQFEMRNTDEYETFDVYQGLIAPPGAGGHRIKARRPDGRKVDGDMPTQTLAERQSQQKTLDSDSNDGPFWTWEMRGDIAVLTMPTWTMYNTKWDWEGWLGERLASLVGAKGLVMDLRDNEGGNECGNYILARLADANLEFAGYEKRVRFRRTPADLDPYLDTWDRSFRTIGENAETISDGFFRLPGQMRIDAIPAAGPKLAVPVAALVGPACSSATFSFARRAKESGLVKLFGQTTGGNLRGINGGAYFFVRLPASGIEFDLPIISYFPYTLQPDAGVRPDIEIAPDAPGQWCRSRHPQAADKVLRTDIAPRLLQCLRQRSDKIAPVVNPRRVDGNPLELRDVDYALLDPDRTIVANRDQGH